MTHVESRAQRLTQALIKSNGPQCAQFMCDSIPLSVKGCVFSSRSRALGTLQSRSHMCEALAVLAARVGAGSLEPNRSRPTRTESSTVKAEGIRVQKAMCAGSMREWCVLTLALARQDVDDFLAPCSAVLPRLAAPHTHTRHCGERFADPSWQTRRGPPPLEGRWPESSSASLPR